MKNNERGSALVLVMFVALLLTILGVAVLGATMGGAQRTETRENDVQSLHLAQRGSMKQRHTYRRSWMGVRILILIIWKMRLKALLMR